MAAPSDGTQATQDHSRCQPNSVPQDDLSKDNAVVTSLSTQILISRVQHYAETGKIDMQGLTAYEMDVVYHLLHRLHDAFVKQFDCDETTCDGSRKCPKCGVIRTQISMMDKTEDPFPAIENCSTAVINDVDMS
jgi:hypothetical protein